MDLRAPWRKPGWRGAVAVVFAALVAIAVIGIVAGNVDANTRLAAQSKAIWMRNYSDWGALSGDLRGAAHAQSIEQFVAYADRYIALADSERGRPLPPDDRVAADVSGITGNSGVAVARLRDERQFPLGASTVAFLDRLASALEEAATAAGLRVSGGDVPADLLVRLDAALSDSALGPR
jgi:hypothetical protein